jgi:murein DD-endopeptidase MepM/ murein hydrolase activator NlpD
MAKAGFDPREPKGAWWRRHLIATAFIAPALIAGFAGDGAPRVFAPHFKNIAPIVADALGPLGMRVHAPTIDSWTPQLAHALGPDPRWIEHLAFTTLTASEAPKMAELELKLGRKQTLSELLRGVGFAKADVQAALDQIKAYTNPRSIPEGQKVKVVLDRTTLPGDDRKILGLTFKSGIDRKITIARAKDGDLTAKEIITPLKHMIVLASGPVRGSLQRSISAAGAPSSAISTFTKAFAQNTDLQREVRGGDTFTLLYETYLDDEGKQVKTGEVLYAALDTGKGLKKFFWFDSKGDAKPHFYDAEGKSGRKTGGLMRTPIDGARITSGFGFRRHPLLGFTRMHSGIDFGAPMGTPIGAAGGGVVVKVGWVNGYGNYVKLRHNGTYETAYGHMSRFAKGLSVGDRVEQGQTIGYVGSTGWSTGAHLHYEIHVNGKPVNPVGLTIQSEEQRLVGRELERFKARKAEIERLLAKAPNAKAVKDMLVAEATIPNTGAAGGARNGGFAQAAD